jgi:hypothetical protein
MLNSDGTFVHPTLSASFISLMQPYSRSVDDTTSPIPDGYQLQLTDDVAKYAQKLWINAVARRLGKSPPASFPIPKTISEDLAEEVHLLAETLADALGRECQSGIFNPHLVLTSLQIA